MKIAVATENGECVSADFYRSPYFVVLDVELGQIVARSIRRNTAAGYFRKRRDPVWCAPRRIESGCSAACLAIADLLRDCSVVLSHRLGRAACDRLGEHGLEIAATGEAHAERAALEFLGRTNSDTAPERQMVQPAISTPLVGT